MLYKYRSVIDGNVESKKIDAESEESAANYLRERGHFLIEIGPANQPGQGPFSKMMSSVSFNDIVDFTRQLAIMLNAGLSIVDSLDILKKQSQKESLRKVIVDIDRHIRSGLTMSIALQKYPHYFSGLYISLVKSGEASGKLDDILLKLSDNLEKQREFRGRLKNALIYPVIVVIAMIGVMIVMVTIVVPKLLELYKQFNVELPITTQLLIGVSNITTQFWPVLIAVFVGIGILIKRYLETKRGKLMRDKILFKIPITGNVIKMAALVDSTRTLSILIGAGVSILEALIIIRQTTDNILYQTAFINVYNEVEKGKSLGSALQEQEIFPPILVQMAIVGENTGHLDETLGRLSKYFELESDLAIKAMTSIIEPLILVVLGIGVGFIVFSVITPIYNLTSSIK
jgi:type IV pilus assembly protein PilC